MQFPAHLKNLHEPCDEVTLKLGSTWLAKFAWQWNGVSFGGSLRAFECKIRYFYNYFRVDLRVELMFSFKYFFKC